MAKQARVSKAKLARLQAKFSGLEAVSSADEKSWQKAMVEADRIVARKRAERAARKSDRATRKSEKTSVAK